MFKVSYAAIAAAVLVGCAESTPPESDFFDVEAPYSTGYGIIDEGRMTGGGSIFDDNGMRITHGVQVRCDGEGPDNLQINWEGYRFHLTDLDYIDCTWNPAFDSENPDAPINETFGQGWGRLNGEEGAFIRFVLRDDGEPGTTDEAAYEIYDPDGNLVLWESDQLTYGNHQAHDDK